MNSIILTCNGKLPCISGATHNYFTQKIIALGKVNFFSFWAFLSNFCKFNQKIPSHIRDFGLNPKNGLWEALLLTRMLWLSEKSKLLFFDQFWNFLPNYPPKHEFFWVQSKLQVAWISSAEAADLKFRFSEMSIFLFVDRFLDFSR